MPSSKIRSHVQRNNPYKASAAADEAGRRTARRSPERTAFFAEREVQNPDGSFPFGEGFLYEDAQPRARAADWVAGRGKPGRVVAAGDQGTKDEQQDAFGSLRLRLGRDEAAVIVAADGVSASGPLASRASTTAVRVFKQQLERELGDLPADEAERHEVVEKAICRAAFAANFEVVRQVLLDRNGNGRFDAGESRALDRATGVEVPTGALTVAEMQRLAPSVDRALRGADLGDRSALTTFAVAVAVDNDLYTFASGDSVISLYRPSQPEGQRVIQLTERDQQVIDLYKDRSSWRRHPDVHENIITDSMGDSAQLSGALRRYPDLLEPGDRVIAASDGLGPRGAGRGLERDEMETAIENPGASGPARALVDAQLADLRRGEYQDNIGVVVLEID